VTESWFPNEEGQRKLENMVERLKTAGHGRSYDCVLGLSGGVDSCYLALKAREWGLRPLAIHVDAGWNSELAVANIERIVSCCGYDLHTHVVDWEEIRDLQLAYLRSAVANQDVPQDHVFFASLYRFAVRNRIPSVLTGGNFATEGIFPASWQGDAMDKRNLLAIHKRFGDGKLRSYATIGFFSYFFWYPFVKGMRTIRPLNFIRYNKAEAMAELEDTVGWRAYPRKHGESLFTRFFQNHYLPTKFGFDKRRPHLSSLIVTGQVTRQKALIQLEEPLYSSSELEADIAFFCKKMRLSRAEWDDLMAAPIHHYSEFPNQDALYRRLKRLQRAVEVALGRRVRVYS